jgi:hypothetical protein
MSKKYRIPMWAIELLVAFALVFGIVMTIRVIAARSETPDEWFKLVATIEQHQDHLDEEDRQFIRYMTNVLTLDQAVMPTAAQQRWLLDIKRRMETKP